MSQFHTYKTAIPDDAKQVAYYSSGARGRAPRIVDVTRRTKTTVFVAGLDETPFRKEDGIAKGGYTSQWERARIVPITPEVLEHIEAQKLHAELNALGAQLDAAVRELVGPERYTRDTASMRANIAKVHAALDALGVGKGVANG